MKHTNQILFSKNMVKKPEPSRLICTYCCKTKINRVCCTLPLTNKTCCPEKRGEDHKCLLGNRQQCKLLDYAYHILNISRFN